MQNEAAPTFGKKLPGQQYRDRPGVYGLLFAEEHTLAVVRYQNLLFLPGGGIEAGENHAACLRREFCEETGLLVQPGAFIGDANCYVRSLSSGEYVRVVGHFYFCLPAGHSGSTGEEDHTLQWLPAAQALEELVLPNQRWALARALNVPPPGAQQ